MHIPPELQGPESYKPIPVTINVLKRAWKCFQTFLLKVFESLTKVLNPLAATFLLQLPTCRCEVEYKPQLKGLETAI